MQRKLSPLHFIGIGGIGMAALAELFQKATDSTKVVVSFVELYNEEIFDLLSANDDTTRLQLTTIRRDESMMIKNQDELIIMC